MNKQQEQEKGSGGATPQHESSREVYDRVMRTAIVNYNYEQYFNGLAEFFVPKKALFNRFRSHVVGNKKTRCVYFDNNNPVLLVAHIDTVQTPALNADGVSGAGFDDRLGCFLSLKLMNMYPDYFDVLWCDYEESGRSTATHFKPPHDYNFVIELDREGDDFVDYGLSTNEFQSLFTEVTHIKQSYGSFSDICSLDSVKAAKINLGVGTYLSHSRNSGFNPYECVSQISRMIEFVRLHHHTHFVEGPGWHYSPYLGYSGYRRAYGWEDDIDERFYSTCTSSSWKDVEAECNNNGLDMDVVYLPCDMCDEPTPEYMYDYENQTLCCETCKAYLKYSGDWYETDYNQDSNYHSHLTINDEECVEFAIIELWMRCRDWDDLCKDLHIRPEIIKEGCGSFNLSVPVTTLLDHNVISWEDLD